jgi:hypothetical protein
MPKERKFQIFGVGLQKVAGWEKKSAFADEMQDLSDAGVRSR